LLKNAQKVPNRLLNPQGRRSFFDLEHLAKYSFRQG
jgi:hypothetical protein